MERIIIDGIEYDLVPRVKSEQDYPIFKRNKGGEVFKITTDDLYSIVLSEESQNIGKTIYNCNSLLSQYEIVPHNKETGLYHLQPVWYNNSEICFWSVKENCPVIIRDNRVIRYLADGAFVSNFESGVYKNIVEPITPEQLKTMPFIWEMYQNLLKKSKN